MIRSQKYSQKHNISGVYLRPETIATMKKYHWPGNLYELAYVVERLVLLSDPSRTKNERISAAHFQKALHTASDQFLPVRQARALWEQDHITELLKRVQGLEPQPAKLS